MPSYLLSSDADALAAVLPGLVSYNAATDDAKTAALEMASERVDDAYKWQGRKYALDGTQPLQFPRVPFDSGAQGVHSRIGAYDPHATYVVPEVWDWDTVNNVAIVPLRILRAVLFEADSVLAGDRVERLEAQHDGVASQSIGSASESYRPGEAPTLCMDADRLVQKYRIKQGRIL